MEVKRTIFQVIRSAIKIKKKQKKFVLLQHKAEMTFDNKSIPEHKSVANMKKVIKARVKRTKEKKKKKGCESHSKNHEGGTEAERSELPTDPQETQLINYKRKKKKKRIMTNGF